MPAAAAISRSGAGRCADSMARMTRKPTSIERIRRRARAPLSGAESIPPIIGGRAALTSRRVLLLLLNQIEQLPACSDCRRPGRVERQMRDRFAELFLAQAVLDGERQVR